MERADLYRVYELGAAIRPISSVGEQTTVAELFLVLAAAKNSLQALLGADPPAKLDLCKNAATELSVAVNQLNDQYFKNTEGKFAYPDDAKTRFVYAWDVWELQRAHQNFEAVFRAEMQAAATYWVPKRGAYSTRDLVDAFERAFLPDLHEHIGEVALKEYQSAGRCFAFGLWTAAGYHSCRAVEAILRPYCVLLSGKPDKEGDTWGDLIKRLKDEKLPTKPGEKTLFYLQQLKDNERNPLMHVRVVLDEQDADLLLGSAKTAIVLMAREIKAFKEAAGRSSIAAAFKTIPGGAA